MRLRRLTLHGFKSFADRTELRLRDGITAVVGPNGCGKSNISDAIRWVLGEQRASAIRGSRMDEAIFHGTAERRGVSRAEVSISFANEGQRLPVPFDQLEFGRTVFREGGSDYRMNGSRCRLKDILEVCRDTGFGNSAYAVIEQGMIDAILSEKTDARRKMFEEAAGIGRYKDRRRTALRRLESTEDDLNRLEDVIAEVRSNVDALARQCERARRHEELRARRLDLEVALALAELEDARAALEATGRRLEELDEEQPAGRAALGAAEAELERRRLEAGELTERRNRAAARLEEVGRTIGERERQLAVADERRANAERRLEQIAAERAELERRGERLEREADALEEQRLEARERVGRLEDEVERVHERNADMRGRLAEAREDAAGARAREEELRGRAATLEARAAGAEERAGDGSRRLERLADRRREIDDELDGLGEQGELFRRQARGLDERRAEREAARERAAERLEALRAEEEECRRALGAAEERASRLAARHTALEALEREHHGFAPAVARVLEERERLDGLVGPLSELLDVSADRAAAAEDALGTFFQTLVVTGDDTASVVRRRLTGDAPEGTVALLPEHAVGHARALLAACEFTGEPPSEPALLGRRERLERLRSEAGEAARERDERAERRAELSEQVAAAERELRAAGEELEAAERELRRLDADRADRDERAERMRRERDELERRRTELESAAAEAREEARAAADERAGLDRELGERERDRERAAERLEASERAWDEVREEESDRRVAHARAESALEDIERRLESAREGREEAARRQRALDEEEAEHRRMLEGLGDVHDEAATGLDALFERRDRHREELRELDERRADADEQASAGQREVRELRQAIEKRGEERHRIELERAEAEANVRGLRERLETEWGRPFEQLTAEAEPVEDQGPEAIRSELRAVRADLERLGPINMLAIEEHEEQSRRLEFLIDQRDDLIEAREDLETAIAEINRTANQRFMQTFDAIRANFEHTIQVLFEGGRCDLELADPDDPLESDVDISASPGGKRVQRIHLLSGGERALTALALLFAIYKVKPSPFCVLDEVDAPLDEANIGRFINMLKRFKDETQFLIITHNPRTIEAADWIYGVTMQEPGVSSIVGVELDEALDRAA